MLFGQSKWKRGRLSEFSFKEGLIYVSWFRNPIRTLFNTVFICPRPAPHISLCRRMLGSNPATLALAVMQTL